MLAINLSEDGVGRSRSYTRHAGSDRPVRPGKEVDLQRFRRAVLLYWAGKPVQRGNAGNQRYRDMRRSAASREIHRERGERFVTRGHLLVSRQQFERVFADGNKLLGAHLRGYS